MVRKARDTGGPLVPYETASGAPSETPAARDGPQGQGHGVPLVETAFRDPGCERWSARPGTREAR
ncbi:hypothetical protein DPMN_131336 [Dreissena polymorpha]|uniref:Uncharacterized protein n=1 Tax=Dreissena polymorpha TaxID=45954 RepID=A0A9D4JYD4_DREPO|nr:hypothetical protein DPMN_131336 [Dreissena polymorpha]